MTRKLASVRIIDEIRPIEGADAIECAVVGGWTVVVKRGEFKAGDSAVYFEIDSFIPTDIAPFLSKGREPKEYMGIRGERLRTVKLRKQLSQGLLIPYTNFPQVVDAYHRTRIITADDDGAFDVTKLLGIVKYEPPVPAQLAGLVKGNWPSLVPKTDEPRIQNLSRSYSQLTQYTYELTEKLEGISLTTGMVDNEFIVCSRNINLKESEDNSYWKIVRKLGIEEKMQQHNLNNLVIQGELIGPGIQGNIYNRAELELYVFSIYDVTAGKYLNPKQRRQLVELLELDHVPVLDENFVISTDMQQLINSADGDSQLFKTKREGLVFKRNDADDHFKVISNAYLLSEK